MNVASHLQTTMVERCWRNSAPSLVSVGGIVSHRWCLWEEYCPVIGVSERTSASLSLSVQKLCTTVTTLKSCCSRSLHAVHTLQTCRKGAHPACKLHSRQSRKFPDGHTPKDLRGGEFPLSM
ncbi:hypothetical protein AB205_0005260 [Aquarana catesbeiana]|uniref:Uncharacterized protein n=1 Tax=Aquarana catesbeiana TaxID=8400 RepID=A0A2G9S6P2_AQUCT|nr:hypothetical protein AB205_0005260 [Aquarana catesbeiana]